MIPICLILFILFIAVITFAIKRADSAQAKVTEEFWEKEHEGNPAVWAVLKKCCEEVLNGWNLLGVV